MPNFKPGFILTTAVLLALSILLYLGTWQLQRLTWKEELISSIAASRVAEPVQLADAGQEEFLRVKFLGNIIDLPPVCIFGTNSDGEIGMFQLQPASRRHGEVVLVNMGWVGNDKVCEAYDGLLGEVNIIGVLRSAKTPTNITPPSDVKNRIWYIADLAGMNTVYDFETLHPYYLDAVLLDGDEAPRESLMRDGIVNNHLQYAITWFGLAASLLAVFIALGFKRGREDA